ncbi:MAG: YicC/YloC family endoribonuclease [Pseudomonadota bacterium]
MAERQTAVLHSMTGFARAQGHEAGVSWHWEARAVNGRGLDIRMRVPSGFEALDPPARKTVSQALARGNVSLNLHINTERAAAAVAINDAALEALAARLSAPPAGLSVQDFAALLSIRGMVEVGQAEAPTLTPALTKAMLATLDATLAQLIAVRREEGQRLGDAISAHLRDIAENVTAIEHAASRTPQALRERLQQQVAALRDADATLEPERLYQEAALLATRADIAEELERLRAHLAAANDLLSAGEPVGRRFDFLLQEFNREANTLCAKAADIEITRHGLALKAAIDQMREQVQNIE